mmetsp:Transcript_31195/g.40349  ORF Transcript_31195/g.40349 Transcript_31195/m.40349 type:complete len:235 (+) Transcript_31195:684-1388(+)
MKGSTFFQDRHTLNIHRCCLICTITCLIVSFTTLPRFPIRILLLTTRILTRLIQRLLPLDTQSSKLFHSLLVQYGRLPLPIGIMFFLDCRHKGGQTLILLVGWLTFSLDPLLQHLGYFEMTIFLLEGCQQLVLLIIISEHIDSRDLLLPRWSFQPPMKIDRVEFIDTLLCQRHILLYHNPLISLLHGIPHGKNKCRKFAILPLWDFECLLFGVILFEFFKVCIPLMFKYIPDKS